MIKVIFFDFDGVLTSDSSGGHTTCKYISEAEQIDYDTIRASYKKYNESLNTGKITFNEIWKDFCKCIGKKIEFSILKAVYESTPKNKKMFSLAKKLKTGFKLGIITDNNKDRFNLLVKKWELNSIFDFLILSADIGALKDSEKIFKAAMNLAQVKPTECVFIDNKKENLEVPAKLGMKTIFYGSDINDTAILEKELAKLGIGI